MTVGSGYKNCVMRGCEESFSQRKAIQIGWMDMVNIMTNFKSCMIQFTLILLRMRGVIFSVKFLP